ncbi:hypothetical protein [Bradyrhizobium liaoningense]|uniref:hypothetical protein n=1 Tax=Bradyrhizobium liaoningense TaxID=43992 RepID=UPI001BA5E42B|nr:hypothetical protein [Bradyrhizobium liaoningense]MBR0714059.1 hypothetical protein [Bradyrhizobium liaoningense]
MVRVTPDDRVPEIWLAATPQDEAVSAVLDIIPEGWAASLVQRQLSEEHAAALNMKREKSGNISRPDRLAIPLRGS